MWDELKSVAKHEGCGETKIVGDIEPAEEYPGCPYCEGKYFVICSCGKLNCNIGTSNQFTCEWCHSTGTLGDYGGEGFRAGGDA